MKKEIINKKKKYTTETYMREALDYEIVVGKLEEDVFFTIKKYLKVSSPLKFKDKYDNDITYIDNGYYLFEITPLNKNYNIRFYFDNNKKFIDDYTDISFYNGIERKLPYYIDFYLDIVRSTETREYKIVDEDELKDALDKKYISKKDYEFAYKIANKLLKELQDNKNEYTKLDFVKIINNYFK